MGKVNAKFWKYTCHKDGATNSKNVSTLRFMMRVVAGPAPKAGSDQKIEGDYL